MTPSPRKNAWMREGAPRIQEPSVIGAGYIDDAVPLLPAYSPAGQRRGWGTIGAIGSDRLVNPLWRRRQTN